MVDSTNFNGKTWLNEAGDVISYAEHVVERFTPIDGENITYTATVTDPVVYTKPWTIRMKLTRRMTNSWKSRATKTMPICLI